MSTAIVNRLPPVLQTNYAPLLPYLAKEGLRELCINQPEELWLEFDDGRWEFHKDYNLNLVSLNLLADSLANATKQVFSAREKPVLACEMPGLKHRIQIASGQMVDTDFAMSMRLATKRMFQIQDFGIGFGVKQTQKKKRLAAIVETAKTAGSDEAWYKAIEELVLNKANILVSGGTSTGKTQFLNQLISFIPKDDRIVTIEDVKELNIIQPNNVRLLKSKTNSDLAGTEYKDIINTTTRMRPDRIICGELDTENTMTFLRSLNTGHDGSMGTVHANQGEALEAIAQNVAYSGKSGDAAKNQAKKVLNVIIQLEKVKNTKVIQDIQLLES